MYDWVCYGLPMFTVYMFPFTPQTMTNLGIPLNIPNHYTVILRKTMGEVIISTIESQKMNVLECASQSISQLLHLESSKSEFAKHVFPNIKIHFHWQIIVVSQQILQKLPEKQLFLLR